MSAIACNGFPTGWTGYAPLADEARAGMDAYIFAFILIAHLADAASGSIS